MQSRPVVCCKQKPPFLAFPKCFLIKFVLEHCSKSIPIRNNSSDLSKLPVNESHISKERAFSASFWRFSFAAREKALTFPFWVPYLLFVQHSFTKLQKCKICLSSHSDDKLSVMKGTLFCPTVPWRMVHPHHGSLGIRGTPEFFAWIYKVWQGQFSRTSLKEWKNKILFKPETLSLSLFL